MNKHVSGIAISVMALAIAQSAAAEQAAPPPTTDNAPQIKDVIVTAQKRSEKLQDVPIAITAITADAIQNRRTLDLVDLSNQAPGLQIKSDDNGANPRIFIRGIGVNDFNPATNSAVGIYADGVYVASPLAQRLAFFDLQQVEVLRGPQGTLYGRNTTGGAINVASRLPGDVPEAIRERFFEKYATSGKRGGTGLGTYTARLVAQAHGGSIELQTGQGEGTVVRVRLPDGEARA
ncbi:MAG: TonB-dependent receptor plug domain-containing protein [Sphingomonadales bacterium]|nr:TonB-dependent receptor plug domain-containing protein [Sphingomonadales bacterium]